MEHLSLSEYELIAYKLIGKWRQKRGKLIASDELVGEIIHAMATADTRYNPDNPKKKTLEKYRAIYGVYAIRNYVAKQNKLYKKFNKSKIKNKHYYPNRIEENPEEKIVANQKILNFLINNSGLTPVEKNMIGASINDMNGPAIADTFSCSTANVYQRLETAIAKMKRCIR